MLGAGGHSARERKLMGELGDSLLDSFTVEELMASSFPLLMKLVPTDGAAFCITKPGRQDDYHWNVSGISLDWFRDYPELVAQDLVRQAVVRRPNRVLTEHEIAPRKVFDRNAWVERSRQMGMSLRHVMAVLLHHGEPGWHGGITLYREKSQPFSDHHRRLLQRLTPSLGRAVRNCRLFAEQARRNDDFEALLRDQGKEFIRVVPPGREVERSAGATSLLERWFSPHQLRPTGLPAPLLDLFSVISRHPPAEKFPHDVWWEIGPDGTNLKVSFIPLAYRQGGPRQWMWLLEERSASVPVPWSWRGELTPEQQEIVAHWEKAGMAVALNARLTPQQYRVAVEAVTTGQELASIGETLGMSEGTVKAHLDKIYEKLGARNRVVMLQLAQRLR